MPHPLNGDVPQTEQVGGSVADPAQSHPPILTFPFQAGAGPHTEPIDGPTPATAVPDDETWKTNPGASAGQVRVAADNSLGLFGAYELLQEIAQGGMGVVYKARHTTLQRVVALKMILSGQFAGQTDVDRFYQEAKAAARLDHPHIVPIYEIGQCEGRHYFTMAFIEGDNLSALVGKKGPLPSREAAGLVAAVADGVQFAHDHGIIHRDLKPDNVLLDRQGRPRVTDFGLAKQVDANAGLTRTGQIMGTPSFMAPEQARGIQEAVGRPADVYALGGILYFLLTGKPPFNGSTLTDVLYQVAHEPPTPPRQLNDNVPPELEAICLKCLQKDPAQRHASAGAVAEALRSWASGQTIPTGSITATPARPVTPPGTAPGEPPSTGRSVLLPLVLAGGLTLVLAGTAFLGLWWAGLLDHKTSPDATLPRAGADKPQDPGPAREVHLNDFNIPTQLRREFQLSVETRPNLDKKGQVVVKEGDTLSFKIEVGRDAYVGIWSINADKTVVQLFPNSEEKDHLLRADRVYTIPGKQQVAIVAAPSGGVDHLWIVASTKRWDPLQGEEAGPFTIFRSDKAKDELTRQLRGFVVKVVSSEAAQPEAVAEEIIPSRVLPK